MAIHYIENHKHLTLDDRIRIETLIEQSKNFSRIAKERLKSSSTISKEIEEMRAPNFYLHISKNIFQLSTPILNLSIEKAMDLQRSNRFVWGI